MTENREPRFGDRLFWGGVLGLTVVGGALRYWGVWENDFWTDELQAIRSSHTWEAIKNHCFKRFSSPPLRYVLSWWFLNVPHEDKWIRLPSLLAGIATIPVCSVLAARWFDRGTGLWTALVVAVNPWLILHSQDARMHQLPLFFFLFGLLCVAPPPVRFKAPAIVLAGLAWAAASAVNYQAVLVCFGGYCFMGVYVIGSRRLLSFREAGLLLAPWMVWMVFWLGWLWMETSTAWAAAPDSQMESSESVVSSDFPGPGTGPTTGLLSTQFYRDAMKNHWKDAPLKWLTLLGLGVFLLSSSPGGFPSRRSRFLLVGVPFFLAIAIGPQQIYPRYGLALLPFPLIGVGVLANRCFKGRLMKQIGLALVLILSLPPSLEILSLHPQPWTEAGRYLRENMAEGDCLLTGSHRAELGVSYYIIGKIPTWDVVFNVFQGERLGEETLQPKRCWLIQWYPFPPHVQEIVDRWYDRMAEFSGRHGVIRIFRRTELPTDAASNPAP